MIAQTVASRKGCITETTNIWLQSRVAESVALEVGGPCKSLVADIATEARRGLIVALVHVEIGPYRGLAVVRAYSVGNGRSANFSLHW